MYTGKTWPNWRDISLTKGQVQVDSNHCRLFWEELEAREGREYDSYPLGS